MLRQTLLERFQRQSDNLWVPQIYRVDDQVAVESIGLTCAIANLYENLEQLSQ